jgi:hypothetical protein
MTKVEGLKEKIVYDVAFYYDKRAIRYYTDPLATAKRYVDDFIDAIRAEQQEAYDKLLEDDNYVRHYNDELLGEINELNDKIATAHEEGATEERNRILNDPNVFENTRIFLVQDAGGDLYRRHIGSFFYVPASVLVPGEREP